MAKTRLRGKEEWKVGERPRQMWMIEVVESYGWRNSE